MSAPPAPDPADPTHLRERLSTLGGLARIRDAAGELPTYLVGGAVRDLLLGRERADLDVVVEGDAAALAERLGAETVWHERFGTAKVTLEARK